jgi:hypothetical protein
MGIGTTIERWICRTVARRMLVHDLPGTSVPHMPDDERIPSINDPIQSMKAEERKANNRVLYALLFVLAVVILSWVLIRDDDADGSDEGVQSVEQEIGQ